MALADKKIAILLDQQYQEMEVWVPYYRFLEAGATVHLVAPKADVVYPSKLGYPCRSTHAAAEVSGENYDAVIFPGGWAPDFMRRNETMNRFTQECVDAGILLAPICHGGWMLCSTDAFRGKRATGFVAIKHDVINAGATWLDEETVVDGNLISARTPDDIPAWIKSIIAYLET
ncbi:MAG: type 1 glutamine amidotransferase [Phycisphaerales bacterium]|jgi:protease I|nr:type 1 glutamine amidotransferase [Phycisphaerales bacterium]MBT7171283.1 type 1 glutamine amidotransferase [Phycisphaerales bacterium]